MTMEFLNNPFLIMGANLLANNQPSPVKRGLGNIVGQSMLQAQPQLLQADQRMRQAKASQAAQAALLDPAGVNQRQLASSLFDMGQPDLALQTMGVGQKAGEQKAYVVDGRLVGPDGTVLYEPTPASGPVNPWDSDKIMKEYDLSQYTPESVKASLAAADPALLQKNPLDFGAQMQFGERAEKSISDIREAVSAGNTMITALDQTDDPYADLASVYSYIRFLDPGSVVREGEVSLMNSALGLFNQVQSEIQKVQGAGFITPAQRSKLKNLVGKLMDEYEKGANERLSHLKGQAGNFGIPWANVAPPPIRFNRPAKPGGTKPPAEMTDEELQKALK